MRRVALAGIAAAVDGVPEGSAQLVLAPQGAGRTSVGTRINRRDCHPPSSSQCPRSFRDD
jgi:hypothetical protein